MHLCPYLLFLAPPATPVTMCLFLFCIKGVVDCKSELPSRIFIWILAGVQIFFPSLPLNSFIRRLSNPIDKKLRECFTINHSLKPSTWPLILWHGAKVRCLSLLQTGHISFHYTLLLLLLLGANAPYSLHILLAHNPLLKIDIYPLDCAKPLSNKQPNKTQKARSWHLSWTVIVCNCGAKRHARSAKKKKNKKPYVPICTYTHELHRGNKP